MACLEFTDLLALVAAGAATDGERDRVERHIQSCSDCRTEYARLREITAQLDTDPREPSSLDQLELENEILRAALEVRSSASVRVLSPWRAAVRIAATLIIFGLGYLTYPLLSISPSSLTEPTGTTSAVTTPAQLRKALNSGLRFSGVGLKAITLGHKGITDELATGAVK